MTSLSAPLLALQLAWWTQVVAALVVLGALLPVMVVGLAALRSIVLEPRLEGRRWPQGVGWGGLLTPIVQIGRAVQTQDDMAAGPARTRVDVACAVGLGAVVSSFVVLPVTSSVAVSNPALGVFVLPALVGIALIADLVQSRARGVVDVAAPRLRVRAAGVVALSLGALALASQWDSGSLLDAVRLQRTADIAGVSAWGLPTALVQPVGLFSSLLGLVLAVSLGPAGHRDDRPRRGWRGMVVTATDVVALLAGSSWLAVGYFGGGGVPWTGSPRGVVTVVGVALLAAKVTVIALVMMWAHTKWRHHDPRRAQFLVGAAVVPLALSSLLLTVLAKAWL